MQTLRAAVLALTVVLGQAAVVSAEATAPPPRCHGQVATVVGTPGDDTLEGTRGPDVIVGLAGDDHIDGLGGDDLLCGGGGGDRLRGGAGDDRLYGGTDAEKYDRGGSYLDGDSLEGGTGDDLLSPGTDRRKVEQSGFGPDVVLYRRSPHGVTVDLAAGTASGWGHDRIVNTEQLAVFGSPHDDVLRGSALRDQLVSGRGDDVLVGRGAHDELFPEGDAIHLPADHDRVYGGPGPDEISTDAGADLVRGGGGDDNISGYSNGASRIYGDAGDDDIAMTVSWNAGGVTDGGGGRNTVDIYDAFSPDAPMRRMTLDLGTGAASLDRPASASTLVRFRHVVLMGAQLRYTITGTDGVERIEDLDGGSIRADLLGGDDYVFGSDHDVIDAGDGVDELHSGDHSTCTHWEKGSCGGVHR